MITRQDLHDLLGRRPLDRRKHRCQDCVRACYRKRCPDCQDAHRRKLQVEWRDRRRPRPDVVPVEALLIMEECGQVLTPRIARERTRGKRMCVEVNRGEAGRCKYGSQD